MDGMRVVKNPKLERDVAIKGSAQQFSDRFEREARAALRSSACAPISKPNMRRGVAHKRHGITTALLSADITCPSESRTTSRRT
jgi:hypothetical protein